MGACLRLARRHFGQTGTNPSVGTLIVVNEGGQSVIVGRGITAKGGRPHAEPLALAEAGDRARGATAYVTLEPCSHYGQTAPCANALIEAGISRCFIAVVDPDPRVNWRGAALLQEAGIDVWVGLCEDEAEAAHEAFFARVTSAID